MIDIKEYKGYIFSIIFHLILALICLGVSVDLSTKTPEFIDITFTAVIVAKSNVKDYKPPPPKISKPAGKKSTTIKKKEIVELPKRKMSDITESEIFVSIKEKIITNEFPLRLGDKLEISGEPERESDDKILNLLDQAIKDVDIENIIRSEDMDAESNMQIAGTNVSDVQDYKIEWVGGQREKLRGNVPAYPEGIRETAIIRLKFEVFPNGTIGDIIPLQKGNTMLENNSINTLKKWQFNPLEKAAPQVIQEGIIAFVYRLE